jgi:hypothetical protein
MFDNCDTDSKRIHIPINRFNIFFKHLYIQDKSRVKYLSDYSYNLDDTNLNTYILPFSNSKIILSFEDNSDTNSNTVYTKDVTFHLKYEQIGQSQFIHLCYLLIEDINNFDFYNQVANTIVTFILPINNNKESKNDILYSTNKPYNNWSTFKVKSVPSFEDLVYSSGVVDECKSVIDNYIRSRERCKKFNMKWKCNILIEGELGTGKLCFIEAISLHYNRRLYDFYISSQTTPQVFQDNLEIVKNGSIIAIRGFELVDSNHDLVNYFIRLLDSSELNNKDIIIFLVCHSSKNIFNSITRYGRIDHIVKLEPLKKNEIKQLFYKMCENATDELFKEFYNQLTTNKKYLSSVSSLSHYLCYHGDTAQNAVNNLSKYFNSQDEYRKNINKQESDKFYT